MAEYNTDPASTVPFTHSFSPTVSAQFETWERVGRWPGLMSAWDRIWPRVQPGWDWLLYGRRVKKTVTFPNATVERIQTGASTFDLNFTATASPDRYPS